MHLSRLHTGIFPLKAFLLPGDTIPIHVFEQPYIQLINAALNNDTPFTIVYDTSKTGSEYGALAHVSKVVNRHGTGELDIVVTCKKVVRIIRTYPSNEDQAYSSAVVEILELPPYEVSKQVKLAYLDYLHTLGNTTLNIGDEEIKAAMAVAEMVTVADLLGALNLESADKLKWVKHQLAGKLDKFITEKLRILTRLMLQEKTESGFYMN